MVFQARGLRDDGGDLEVTEWAGDKARAERKESSD